MNNSKRQIALILILNVSLGIALLFGVHKTIDFVNSLSHVTINSINGFSESLKEYVTTFLSLDIKLIFGIFGAIGIVFFDLYVVSGYLRSFKMTKKRVCKSCSKRLIREQRLTGDRIVSYIIPVKRFRCVGCGQHYLRLDNGQHVHEHETIAVSDAIHVKAKN